MARSVGAASPATTADGGNGEKVGELDNSWDASSAGGGVHGLGAGSRLRGAHSPALLAAAPARGGLASNISLRSIGGESGTGGRSIGTGDRESDVMADDEDDLDGGRISEGDGGGNTAAVMSTEDMIRIVEEGE